MNKKSTGQFNFICKIYFAVGIYVIVGDVYFGIRVSHG